MAANATMTTLPPGTRRWRRYQVTVPVRITVEKSRLVSVINSHASYLNAGGLVFFGDTDLEIGDEVEIALTGCGLTLRAVVRNRASSWHGVKFLATNPDEAEQLGLFRRNLGSRMGPLDA